MVCSTNSVASADVPGLAVAVVLTGVKTMEGEISVTERLPGATTSHHHHSSDGKDTARAKGDVCLSRSRRIGSRAFRSGRVWVLSRREAAGLLKQSNEMLLNVMGSIVKPLHGWKGNGFGLLKHGCLKYSD